MTAFNTFRRLLNDDKGATAIEYGLIAALIVIAMIAGMSAFANETIGMWERIQTAVSNAR